MKIMGSRKQEAGVNGHFAAVDPIVVFVTRRALTRRLCRVLRQRGQALRIDAMAAASGGWCWMWLDRRLSKPKLVWRISRVELVPYIDGRSSKLELA
jgi:hypothetical protein